MNRIKYYSPSDLSINFYYDRLKKIIETCDDIEIRNILDILEEYNILKFIYNGIYPTALSNDQIKKAKIKFNKEVKQFFSMLTKEEILSYFKYFFSYNFKLNEGTSEKIENESIDKERCKYREDFLECFERYKLEERINEVDLRKTIEKYEVVYFLNTQFFINKYPNLMKDMFLAKVRNFEFLLDNYTDDRVKRFIPQNITKDEMYKFCEQYIEYEFTNSNYIRMIRKGIQGIKELKIDAKLKLKAKRRCDQIEKKIFNRKSNNVRNGITQNIVIFSEKKDYASSKEELKSLIDIEYLKQENSKEKLLDYTMYLNHFFTNNWILDLCSFPNLESSTIVRTLGVLSTKKNYEESFYFHSKNRLILLSFKIFQEKLQEYHDLRIEELIAHFFTKYSKEQFLIDWLPLDFAGKAEKMHIQTKNLFTLEEQIRKQWELYVDEKKIDKELFELEATPRLSSLKSLLNRKYIYINDKNKNIQTILNLLFSDQSDIIYINESLNEKDFLQLIFKNKIKKSDFHNYQQLNVDFLLDNNVISLDKEENIVLTEKQLFRISIISNIYHYGVIHYYYTNKKLGRKKIIERQQREIDEMIEEGLLTCENTLFAKPEVDYLNYILNNSEFDNALGLRNRYLHGSIVEENEADYLYALIVLIIYVIKINEELILHAE